MDNFKYFDGKYMYQYVATVSGGLALLSAAMHIGWPSPSLPILLAANSDIPISNSEGGWISVATVIGAPIGCILSAVLADRIGRKTSLLITSPLSFTGWLIVGYASSAFALASGRFLGGIASGLTFTLLPMYISEMADKRIRGFLCSIVVIAYNIGLLAINMVGMNLSIKGTALCSSIVPVVFFFTFYWAPESPYFLLSKRRNQDAAKSLKRLTGKDNVDGEMFEVEQTIQVQSKQSIRLLDIFSVRSNRKALSVVVGLLLLQHLSGVVSITFYCVTIFREANGAIKESYSTIIYFTVTLFASVLSSILVDRTGRKPLLIASTLGLVIGLLAEGIYFYLKNKTGADLASVNSLPLIALLLCTVSFNIGLKSVPILMCGELFATSTKAVSTCVSHILYNIFATIVGKLFQIVKDKFGLHLPFFVFAACCFLGLGFIISFVPETKGKTLEQIQVSLQSKSSRSGVITNAMELQEGSPLKSKE